MGAEAGRGAWRTAAILALAGVALSGCASYVERYTATFETALTASDRAMMVETAQAALESNKSGEGANWSNPESGHRGTVTPVATFDEDTERPCREYQQTVTVGGKTGVAYHTACRAADGTWTIRGSTDPAGVNAYWEPPGYRPPDYGRCCPPYWYDDPYYWHRYPYYRYPYDPYYRYRYSYRHPYYASPYPFSLHLGVAHAFGD